MVIKEKYKRYNILAHIFIISYISSHSGVFPKYKKDFNDLIKSLMYSKVKNFKDFLFAVGKYWKFVIKLNIYI